MSHNHNPIDGQVSTTAKYLSNKHLIEWCQGSAVDEAIARLAIESLTTKELNERVRPKVPIKTGGWWCRGVLWRTGQPAGNWYGQGKPDKPHHPEGEKERKYLTGSGMEPDAIFLAMPNRNYWAEVHADKSIPRHWTEGVKKAGAGLTLGLATIALTGVWNWGKDGKLAKFVEEWAEPGTVHYIDFDSDYAAKPSCRAAIIKFATLLINNGCTVHITCWDTKFKGMDDLIVGKGGETFLQAVAEAPTFAEWEKNLKKSDRKKSASSNISSISHPRTQENVVYLSPLSSKEDDNSDSEPIAAPNFCQIAESKLYSDGHWKSIGGQLYQFVGSHYELRPEVEEKRRIGDWLNKYAERTKSGAWVHNRAKASYAGEVFAWVVGRKAIDPNKINPDGLNCSNGVLKVNSNGTYELLPHDPEKVFTYVGCKFDPAIDPADCDRLLECLEPSQREIFLRTAAAALNLKIVRSKLTGRGVKGLLCHGEGSNGKDTLRSVLAAVYGNGMTGKSLSDFRSYDTGRKFTLAAIEGSICNWASENTGKIDLDGIQSLKQFITGDPLDIERKGKDSYEYKAGAIFLANCNKLPSITGGTEAIEGRYGILRFDKTYAKNAIAAEGQLEADPRFKDDEKFILERIAPAMLNKMLERWPLLLSEGIDYKATKEAMQKAQEESRHLWQFVRDAGIEVQAGGRIYIKDLWERLLPWYEETGTLEIEPGTNDRKDKLIWHDLPNKYDTPVKAINQVFARFSEIFPKLQKLRYMERGEIERKGQWYLSGISFANIASPASPVDLARVTASPTASPKNTGEASGEATTLSGQAGEAGEAVCSLFTQIRNSLPQLTDSERQELAKMLAPSNIVQVKKGLRVRYIGSKYAEQYAGLELVVDTINLYKEITCTKPDGRFTTWLSPQDLEAID